MSRWEHRYLGQERFPDALSTMEIRPARLRQADNGGAAFNPDDFGT
jgi:hypothetical protein